MKKLLFLTIMLFTASLAFASAGDYSFSSSTGTYTEITGGTVSTATGQYGAENIDLPFTFNYDGIDYTTARISVNGWLEMGQTYTGQGYINYLSSTTWSPFLAPLWDNLYARGAPDNTEIRYETTGTAPNRTFIVQWKNICWWSSGSTVNFQVKLEETTNKIHFCYGINNSTESRSASIGINDASSGNCHFLSVTPGTPPTTSTTSDNNSISTDDYPGDGVIYTFELIGFDMTYSSGTTTQDNTDDVRPGFTNHEVIGIEVVVTCGSYSIDATSFTLNTTGTTAVSDIENARLWYTGTCNSFFTNTQFGSVVAAPNGSFTITGTQTLEPGTNHFWLTYDVKDNAVEDNFIDAECTSVTVDGSAEIPTVTAPAGNRQIKRFFVIGTGTGTQYNIPSRLRYNYGWSATIFLASEINSYAVITKLSYYVGNSPSNYVTDDQKIYMCNTDDATFADATKPDPSTMTLVYDGTITWNGSGWHEITLTTTFGYDNNKNLMIYYENRDGSGITSGYPEWRYSSTYSNYRAKYNNGYSFPTGSGIRTYSRPNIKIEYDQASPMAYSSCTTTQNNTGTVQPGVADREIIGIEVVTTGLTDPIDITSFTLNTTGTTSSADIENAKLWYTGTTGSFATDTQFGAATAAPDGSFTITGTQTLTNGTNYFWLTYDIKLDASVGNFVDAECTQINDNAKAAHVPTVTAPAGNRQIERLVIIGTGTIARNTTPFYGYNDYGWSVAIFLASEINISADITKLSYYVNNSPSNFIVNDQKIYMCNTDDATFADGSKPDPSSMTLVYDGTITWNGSGWHEITLTTTFGYDNSKNLMIYYENRDGSSATDCPQWYHTSTSPNYRSKYNCADGSFPNGDGPRIYDRPNIKIEYDEVSDMAYSSSTVTQNNTYSVKLGSNDAEIVGIEVVTTGVTNPVNITEFNLNTTGCTDASNDIVNAKLWCTGSSNTFATTSQFGATYNNPNGSFIITGSQQLLAGKTYFWLTYSIAPGATEENVVDAQCTQITDNAKAAHVPTVTSPAGSRTIKGALNGIYSIGATGYDYASISDAIADLGILGVDGACTFHLRDAAYAESPMTINPITGASAINTVTFKPYTGVSPTITITVIIEYDAGFLLNGADHIIFDGSNNTTSRDMTIVMAGDDSRAFVLSGGDGATYNTIKNCVIEGYASNSGNNGILVDGTDHDNNTFENNEIYKNGYGIRLYGSTSDDNTGNAVKDNMIGSATAAKYVCECGIKAERQTNLEISGNEVYNIIQSYRPYGIYVYDSDNVTVSKNNIHDIVSTGTSGYGGCGIYIYIMNEGSNIIIKNNLIRHIAGGSNVTSYVPTGIWIKGYSWSSGVKIYYNSIYLTPDANYGLSYENNNWATAITIDDGPTQIDMRNNIFRTSLGEKTGSTNTTYGYAVWCKGSSEPFSYIDNNVYYVDNQDNNYVGLVGTAVPPTGNKTLAAWRSFAQGDANSTDSDPLYISTTDLHLSVGSPAFNAGTPIAGITTDYDGETRNVTTPTIGAFEMASSIYVWEGTTDNDWNTAGNWKSSTVPTDANDVIVPVGCTNYPTITAAATCNDITIESDATGDASLIDNGNYLTVSGNATVKRYLTDGKWHFVSSPVNNATVNSLYFNHSPDVWLKKFIEPASVNGDWEYISNLTTPMPFGKGFACWVGTAKADVTAEFQGPLHTSTNLTLTTSTTPALSFTDAAHGFNLVGNPFVSALDWDIGTWVRTNLEGSVWVWDPVTSNYLYRNLASGGTLTDGIIPLCQAFFIRANAGSPALTIPIDARVHSDQSYYKNKDTYPYITLKVEKNTMADEVWICFTEEGTYGFDNGWDVSKFFSSESPQLYLQEQENKYSIDVLPPITEEERIIEMGFIAGIEGTHKITAASFEYMPLTDIFLEDLKIGILQKLNDNPVYSFTGIPEDDPDRFLVHFHNLSFGIDYPNVNENNPAVKIYAWNKTVYIKCEKETINQTGTVRIYDMYGKQLINTNLSSVDISRIHVPVSNNLLIVKVIKGNMIYTGKVFIR